MANGRILSTIHLPNFVETADPLWRYGGGKGERGRTACVRDWGLRHGVRVVSGVRVAVQLIPCMIPCMNAMELNPPLLITPALPPPLPYVGHCTVQCTGDIVNSINQWQPYQGFRGAVTFVPFPFSTPLTMQRFVGMGLRSVRHCDDACR